MCKKSNGVANDTYVVYVAAAFPIPVTITAITIPDHDGPVYTPGLMVQLTCTAAGGFGPLVTNWTSTCIESCFILQEPTSSSIATNILHSVDGGNHTCAVQDDVGNTGSATMELLVEGMDVYTRV